MAAKPTTDDNRPAIDRLNTPGPETEMLRPLSGTFTVENRLWPEPGADPVVWASLPAVAGDKLTPKKVGN